MCSLIKILFLKVYVNTTQKNYTQGEFVANLFLQGVMHSSDANMAGFIKTCENRANIIGECNFR